MNDVFLIFAAAGAIHGFILAFLLWFKKPTLISNQILSILVLAMGINLFTGYFKISGFIIKVPILFYFVIPNSLFGYLFHMYIFSLFGKQKKSLLHTLFLLLPTSLFLLWQVNSIIFPVGGSWDNRINTFTGGILTIDDILYSILTIIHNLVYVFVSWKIFLKTKYKFINNYFSNKATECIHWFIIIMFLFWCAHLLVFIAYALNYLHGPNAIGIILFSGAILVYTIGIRMFIEQNDDNNKKKSSTIKASKNKGLKYGAMRLEKQRIEKIINKIESFIEKDKLWKIAGFTLQDLSETTGIQQHYISQAINRHKNESFYTFINAYRLLDVIRYLKNPDFKYDPIIGIAYKCGFNSKTTFNTLFRERFGMTPSQYRKKCLSSSSSE